MNKQCPQVIIRQHKKPSGQKLSEMAKRKVLHNTDFLQRISEVIIENLRDEEEALTLNTVEKQRMLEQDKCS
jgi:hypothetical protein